LSQFITSQGKLAKLVLATDLDHLAGSASSMQGNQAWSVPKSGLAVFFDWHELDRFASAFL
jgi:hypothetical protein